MARAARDLEIHENILRAKDLSGSRLNGSAKKLASCVGPAERRQPEIADRQFVAERANQR